MTLTDVLLGVELDILLMAGAGINLHRELRV
jgi:hypothetical protein